MRYQSWCGLELSRLTLGTVQLGMPYGIANRAGQPSLREARDIVACAHRGGVNCLDTAATYGASEEVLGQVLQELGLGDAFAIVTKIAPVPDGVDEAAARRCIEVSITQSLRRLRRETLAVGLFHSEGDARYLNLLRGWKERGVVQRIGVSVTTPQVAGQIVRDGGIDALQVPCNLFDARFIAADVLGASPPAGLAVFARSVFLQGLMVLPRGEFKPELAPILPVRDRLEELAREHGLSLLELAARYVPSRPQVASVLVGVETAAQMRENLALFENELPRELVEQVEAVVPPLPHAVLSPPLWPR